MATNSAPDQRSGDKAEQAFRPFVPASSTMTEFTIRALVLGLLMCVILGAANAYLGLRAGMTIAATYPAAVIAMAVLRLRWFKGSILEENFARTVGSIGESVAAGAIFTVPAFVILGMWKFDREHLVREYLVSSALMILGGILGIMFVTVLRRVMVEDRSLPFPESVAASEIHKAGQRGAEAALQLFRAMGVGALIKLLGEAGVFASKRFFFPTVGTVKASLVRLGLSSNSTTISAGGVTQIAMPEITPAYFGVGYIIGPELGALNFAGGVLAWGLLVPLLLFFLGPGLIEQYVQSAIAAAASAAKPEILTAAQAEPGAWTALISDIYRYVVRQIAVGGMLVGACYTLWKMRKNLIAGIRRSVADVKKSATAAAATERTERDLSLKLVLFGVIAIFVLMTALYFYFTSVLSGALLAAIVMLVTGFFFAAVSGNLVGLIGSSNNPISGLTLATIIIAALTMVIVGIKGPAGVAAALGVAAIGCISAAVAGEMLQDLKVGHILGGTPWRMQAGDIAGVVVAGLVMFFPLYLMHTSDLAANPTNGGFGGANYSAPQASLMAALALGIGGGEMAWPLVLVGIALGISMILIKVRSPMLFAVGMYLPLETTFAIFIGGILRGIVDRIAARRAYNAAQKARVENAGVLTASGLIAGEALMGLFVAGAVAYIAARAQAGAEVAFWKVPGMAPYVNWTAIVVFVVLAAYMVMRPLRHAGAPDEPAPPTAIM